MKVTGKLKESCKALPETREEIQQGSLARIIWNTSVSGLFPIQLSLLKNSVMLAFVANLINVNIVLVKTHISPKSFNLFKSPKDKNHYSHLKMRRKSFIKFK